MKKVLVTMLFLTGCVTPTAEKAPPQAAEPVAGDSLPPLPLHLPPAGNRSWQPAWSEAIARAIQAHSPQLLANDAVPLAEIRSFCPGFAAAKPHEKMAFWVAFLAAVSRYESSFNPRAQMTEPFHDPETHRPEISIGLLQLSYSDRLNHPDCRDLDRRAGNLADPTTNLGCGVAILRRQLQARGTLFPKPHPYYWAVLTRPKQQKRVRAWLKAAVEHEPYCQTH